MNLPLLISVPHVGLCVPPEVERHCVLSAREIAEDGDVGAREIYNIETVVAGFVTTDVARAIVDMNRAEDDRRADGIVKTHTCWNVPVYRQFPDERIVTELLDRYYRPYHRRLTELAARGVRLGIDCHTMAAVGPPIGPGAGVERPAICLSNADATCSDEWIDSLARCFEQAFDHSVSINEPFKGGYIISTHAAELPWVQLELSRAPFISNSQKRKLVVDALREWCGQHARES